MSGRWFLTVAAVLAVGPAFAQPRFNLYDLGDLGALQGLTSGYSQGVGINNAGQVVGNSITPDLYGVGFRTGPGGLGQGGSSLLGLDNEAYGINDGGQVVGMYTIGTYPNYDYRPFRTSTTGVVGDPGTDLGTLGGHIGKALAINSSGQAAGFSEDARGYVHAFRTTATGRITDPGADLGILTIAYAINDTGQVTGQDLNSLNPHAYRTTPTGLPTDPGADLGTLGGSSSIGLGINAIGQITGYSITATGASHAFRTSANGLISDPGTDLGVLPGGESSGGLSINALGHVVGEDGGPKGATAFYYDTQMWDLNALIQPGTGWYLTWARGINDLDWITGDATVNGATRGFLLIPVDNDPGTRTPIAGIPEPSSLALGAAAAIGGWLLRRSFLVRRSAA